VAHTAVCRPLAGPEVQSSQGARRAAASGLRLAEEAPIQAFVSFSALLREVLDEQAETGLLDLMAFRSSSH
jgi:hypothetical protein